MCCLTADPGPVFASFFSGLSVIVEWWLCPFLSPNDVEKATATFLLSWTDE